MTDTYAGREIHRLDVETTLGVVHLAGFSQKPDHRTVIFDILSDFVGEAVTAADLEESKEDTRPRFPKLDFDVNWTHSDGYCVVAFGEHGSRPYLRIGVDLERHLHKRLHLAERFFSAEESALIKSLEASADVSTKHTAEQEFFRLWCRKEAYYKCVGGDFFEGALRRNMLRNPVLSGMLQTTAASPESSTENAVHFVDMDGSTIGSPTTASLCIAIRKPESL